MDSKGSRSYQSDYENGSSTGLRRSESSFKPTTQNRATVVSRTTGGSYPGAAMSRNSSMRNSLISMPTGQYAEMSSQGVTTFKEERTQEKADMQDLNNRLANYMEKMRYLEALNKALEKEIEKLKKGKDVDFEKIKNMYDDELKQAKNVINELSRDKAEADVKVLSLEDENNFLKKELEHDRQDKDDYKSKADRLCDQIGDLEADINNFKSRSLGLEDDLVKSSDGIKRLQYENDRLRQDLDTETIAHINEANRAQGLEEELAFVTQVYEQEIKELQELAKRDTTIEMRDFWKGEMGSALKEIQGEYDSRLNQISNTLECKYNAQLGQINSGVNRNNTEMNFMKEENKKLSSKYNDTQSKIAEMMAQNAGMEARNRQLQQALKEKECELEQASQKYDTDMYKVQNELENVLREMQMLMDAKLSLELEIAAYRKLLESEEGRFKSAMESFGGFSSNHEDHFANMMSGSGKHDKEEQKKDKPETTGRLTINRTSRGGVTFADITPDGKCITISNNSSGYRKKDLKLKGWVIEREFEDLSPPAVFKFPDSAELKAGEDMKIFGEHSGHFPIGPNELVANGVSTWGMGQADTVLKDDAGAQKATHKQTFTV